MPQETIWRVICLGAGVQSSALYLLVLDGEIDLEQVHLAIFADTAGEPADVYSHLEWLKSQATESHHPKIHVASKGNLLQDALHGRWGSGLAPSLPVWLADETGKCVGTAARHCTRDYKIRAISTAIRSQVLGLPKYGRWPAGNRVIQYFGISIDEAGRAPRIRNRVHAESGGKCEARFPLIDEEMTRADCKLFLSKRVSHEVPRSACKWCPYRSDKGWAKLKQQPAEWAEIVQVDHSLRTGAACSNGLTHTPYLHKSCKPIDEVDFSQSDQDDFAVDCEGGCGL